MKKLIAIVNDDTAGALLSLLGTEKGVHSLTLEAIDDGKAPKGTRQVGTRHHRLLGGQNLYTLVTNTFAKSPHFTKDDAEKAITDAGYRTKSLSSTLSRLIEHGFIRRDTPDYYRVLKVVPVGLKLETIEHKASKVRIF